MTFVPIIHARIHAKIEERANGNIIGYSFLKEWVARMIVKKGSIPSSDVHHTILDLAELGLITKVSRLRYKLNNNKDKRLKNHVF